MENKSYITFDTKVENSPAPANPTGEQKFQTCVNRSPEEVEKRIPKCCGNSYVIKAYNCNKLNIFPLTLLNCVDCKEYINKNATT